MLSAILTLAGLGVLASVGLGLAARVFAVEIDPRVEQMIELLPGANCGGCGFAGCAGYAEAVVSGRAAPGLCPVASAKDNEAIGKLLGVDLSKMVRRVAVLRCQGDHTKTFRRYEYFGVMTCRAAHLLSGGSKGCVYGCLGYGDCERACKFDSIKIIDGLNNIEQSICTGCGACARACPRNLIDIVPENKHVHVMCKSPDKGSAVMRVCSVGCTACKKCEKACPVDAIHVIDDLSKIDYEKCIDCGACARACPSHCIFDGIEQRYYPEITDDCPGCLLCKKRCPVGAISGEKKQKHTVDLEKCVQCGICFTVCKKDTIRRIDPANVATHMLKRDEGEDEAARI